MQRLDIMSSLCHIATHVNNLKTTAKFLKPLKTDILENELLAHNER